MGARVYIPTLGRFLSVDPVEDGTDNNYVYANDPVNEFDLDGRFIPLAFIAANAIRIAAPYIARAAVKYIAKPAATYVVKKAVPYLVKKVTTTSWKKISMPSPRAGLSKVLNHIKKNNLIRFNTKRIAFGPAKSHYKDGRIGSRIVVHFEVNWSKKKILYQNHVKKITKCWGKNCYGGY